MKDFSSFNVRGMGTWNAIPCALDHVKIFRVVKLLTILMFAGWMHVSANGSAQTVTLKVREAPLTVVFKSIKKQTGYSFFYDHELLAKTAPVTLDITGLPLTNALDQALAGTSLDYTIVKRQITIRAKVSLPSLPVVSAVNVHSTDNKEIIDVVGQVRDANGTPVIGATVRVQGSNKNAITDEEGRFTLKGVDPNSMLLISSVGYETSLVSVAGKRQVVATLVVKLSTLDEAVVKGYYATTKRLNTGNVSTVRSVDIERQPVSNPISALQGRVPGLVINHNTGLPGGGMTIQIRGQNSITNGNDPFFVIDGVPYVSQLPGAVLNGALRGGSPFNFLNPSDIESIEVLKDADATAIYGSRAANGVILITTKKGKAGATKVTVNAYSGIGKVAKFLNLLNTNQYLQMRREAFKNDAKTPIASDYDVNGVWDTTRYTDWQKELMGGTAHINDLQATMSGGSNNVQYLFGGGYHKETVVFPGNGADQDVSVRSTITASSPSKKLKAQLSVNYLVNRNTLPINDFTSDATALSPNAPALYNEDGSLNWSPVTTGGAGTWTNPLSYLSARFTGNNTNLISSAFISYSPLPGLELKTSFGYNSVQGKEKSILPTTVFDPGFNVTTGNSSFNTKGSTSWIIEPQIAYKIEKGDWQISALVGSTFNKNSTDFQRLYATGFSSDALLENPQAATSLTVQSIGNAVYKYNALFGRLNFSWKDKYLINFTARRDGSSRFGPENKFANFGAVGAAWIFSEEHWLKEHVPFLSFGKLRASYGTSGNDQIGDYRFLDVYSTTQYPYANAQGLYPGNLLNAVLGWEQNKKIEGGIEIGLWKDRIFLSASYYRNRSGNQLVTTPLSSVTGFPSIPGNLPAVVQNTGFELAINAAIIKGGAFSWNTSFNLTIPRNKLISFPNLATSGYANSYVIGQPISIIKVYRMAGVNDTTGAYELVSAKGGNTSTPANGDQLAVINLMPKYYGGWQNNIQFKGITLDFLFQYQNQIGRLFRSSYSTMPGRRANQPTYVLNRWQQRGDQTNIQAFSQNSSSPQSKIWTSATGSDFAYGDASFIRLKNVSLSWELPQNWTKKMHLDNLRVYAQGQNLLTITSYDGRDPETLVNVLPPLRIMTAGVQFTF